MTKEMLRYIRELHC